MTQKQKTRTCSKCQFSDDTGLRVCPNDGTPLRAKGKDKLIGTTIAEKYQILSMLGRGGMSVVYKARHLMMDRLVAVKMLRPELVAVPQLLMRFKQESKAVSALRHPNIITVFDFGLLKDATPFLIMDYLEGKTLSEVIKEEGRLEIDRAIPLFAQACDALAHSHDRGVVHRDIKPANLLIRQEPNGTETLTIFDFGIAKMLGQDGSTINKLTTSGEVFGSPLYMSPEQCSGEKVDARSDIYSLACVLHETIMGTPPFKGDSPMDTLMKHLNERPRRLTEVDADVSSGVPAAVKAAILKALEKEPADRHASMSELRDEILAAANLQMVSPGIQATSEQKVIQQQTPSGQQPPVTASGTTSDVSQPVPPPQPAPPRRTDHGDRPSPAPAPPPSPRGGKQSHTVVVVSICIAALAVVGSLSWFVYWMANNPDFTYAGKQTNKQLGTNAATQQSSGGNVDSSTGEKPKRKEPDKFQTAYLGLNEQRRMIGIKTKNWRIETSATVNAKDNEDTADFKGLKTARPAPLLADGDEVPRSGKDILEFRIVRIRPDGWSPEGAAIEMYKQHFDGAAIDWGPIECSADSEFDEVYLQEIRFAPQDPDRLVKLFFLYCKRGDKLYATEVIPLQARFVDVVKDIEKFVVIFDDVTKS